MHVFSMNLLHSSLFLSFRLFVNNITWIPHIIQTKKVSFWKAYLRLGTCDWESTEPGDLEPGSVSERVSKQDLELISKEQLDSAGISKVDGGSDSGTTSRKPCISESSSMQSTNSTLT